LGSTRGDGRYRELGVSWSSPSCGRSSLYSVRTRLKQTCCAARVPLGGRIVSRFSVRCIRSLLPVLLWMRGMDEFGEDAQANPPHGQGGEPSQRRSREEHVLSGRRLELKTPPMRRGGTEVTLPLVWEREPANNQETERRCARQPS
jgi:hypothetical protein